MKFTIELDKKQTNQFHDIVAHTLQSFTYQEAVLKDSIENYLLDQEGKKPMSDEEFQNLTKYLKEVTENRLFFADILAKLLEQIAESTPKPLESTIIPAQVRNPIDDAKERNEWVDAAIDDLLGQ